MLSCVLNKQKFDDDDDDGGGGDDDDDDHRPPHVTQHQPTPPHTTPHSPTSTHLAHHLLTSTHPPVGPQDTVLVLIACTVADCMGRGQPVDGRRRRPHLAGALVHTPSVISSCLNGAPSCHGCSRSRVVGRTSFSWSVAVDKRRHRKSSGGCRRGRQTSQRLDTSDSSKMKCSKAQVTSSIIHTQFNKQLVCFIKYKII